MAPPPATRHNPQSQPLTTLLRLICESYPPNTCLRELLQNADDAGATEIEYILDTNTYVGEPLLHGALAEYQGPALLARNNSVFTDDDLASLSAVGDSRKRHDAESTGKFGQGFNSVYHFTDGPWVYSRSLLLMLDPHKTWSRKFSPDDPGGPMWDVVEGRDSAEIQNHLNAFRAFDLDYTRSNNETIIRIPLRTRQQASTSKIFQQEISVQNIKDALEDFGQEIQEGGLLFLKHVRKIIIRFNHDVVLLARILDDDLNSASMRMAIPTDFKQRYAPNIPSATRDLSKAFEMKIEFCTRQYPNSRLFSYIVQHTMMTSSGDKKLDIWARERKLYPWVAIAAPLKEDSDDDPFYGRLFSTLRLPVRTNQPVHIHGLFSITPDRGRLSSSGQSPGYEDLATKWNTFMFGQCVSTAWASLLAHRSPLSWREEKFALWPRAEFTHSELWDNLDDGVIDLVIKSNLAVWNASNGRCVDVNHGFFAPKDGEATTYGPALAAALIPVVYLDGSLLKKVEQRVKLLQLNIRFLTPVTVRQFLRQHGIPAISSEIHSIILEFCLLDAIRSPLEHGERASLYNDFYGIQIWPTVSGNVSFPDNVDLILPRHDAEMQLFSKSKAITTLNIHMMSPSVGKLLLNDIKNLTGVMRFRGVKDLVTDWPVMYPMLPRTENSRGWEKRAFGLDSVLHDTWAWIAERVQEGQRIDFEISRDLWLLPMNDFRIRKLAPKTFRTSLLIIEKHEPLFDLLVAIAEQDPLEMPPLLDTDVLPKRARDLLRNKRSIKTDALCTCIDDPETFIDWLAAGKELLAKASDEEKTMLLSHLETLTRDFKFPFGLPPSLMGNMRKLPLYSKISCSSPFEKRSHTKCGLDPGGHMYWTPKSPPDFPSLPDIFRVSFYDPQNETEKLVMGRFKALQNVTPKELLTLHLLPWMQSIPSDAEPLWEIPKANLIEWIMKDSRRPSKAWLTEVINHPIIPLPLQDGKRQYRCLAGMVDPSSELAKLYDEKESVFPCPDFFSRHKEALIACGIATQPTWSTPAERARYFSQCEVDIETLKHRVDCLLKLSVGKDLISSASEITDIRTLKWLPGMSHNGEFTLLAPNECRGADQSYLVDLVWTTTNIIVKASWKKVLGWDQSIPAEILLRQLDLCLAAEDYDKAGKVIHQIEPDDYPILALKPCFLGRSGGYFSFDKVFLPGSQLRSRPLAPYLDELDAKFAKDHERLVTGLALRSQPSVQDLQRVQDALNQTVDGQLTISELGIAIATLEIATRLGYDPQDLRIPDATMTLRKLKDIVHGDPISTGDIAGFNFTHPEVSNDLARRLDVENSLKRAIRLKIDFDSEDEDNYTPKEKLKTVISDTLERYPIQSTFNEFLANADDAGARKITWILDECQEKNHTSSSLLTNELKPFQGPALFVYNDAIFSKKDFAGFKDIGQGGKKGDINSIGMFGRGALSMYHFTDVPMLLSSDSFLVLDPQQRVLPINYNRRRERKVGTKISLSAVNRLAPDQLAPFLGLYTFVKDLEHYDGTIFRFPLRTVATETLLKDHMQHVDRVAVRSLLEDYMAVARTALLFLRSVESIEFRIRDQEDPQWSVIARRSQRQDSDICQDVEITSTQGGRLRQVDQWCVGHQNISQIPVDILRFGRGAEKSAECGIAICLTSGKTDAEKDTIMAGQPSNAVFGTAQNVDHKVFGRLPTGHASSLPVSFHASFAVTGDRRSIALEDTAENSAWNKWLLTSPLTSLYLETLRHLAPILSEKVMDFWPSTASFDLLPTLSGTLGRGFWTSLFNLGRKMDSLFPLIPNTSNHQNGVLAGNEVSRIAISLAEARFDFLPSHVSQGLRPLLVKLCPNLVRLPPKLWPDYKRAATEAAWVSKDIDADYLCHIFFNDENCNVLEAFIRGLVHKEEKRATMAMLLKTMLPQMDGTDMTPMNIFSGCRVLPRPDLDAPLGFLLRNAPPGSPCNYIATADEQELFAFASDSMVNTELSKDGTDLVGIFMKASFNVRTLSLTDLGDLLGRPQSPTNLSSAFGDRDVWMLKFWDYVNPKMRVLHNRMTSSKPSSGLSLDSLLAKCGLCERAIYRYQSNKKWCYLTPREFEAQPCVIEPLDDNQRKLCEQIPNLRVIDRKCVPSLLLETEGDLKRTASFGRLLKAFEQLGRTTQMSTKLFVCMSLNSDAKQLLRALLLNRLLMKEPSDISLLRSLPIWRRLKNSDNDLSVEHVAAEDAKFCGHAEMLLPWVDNLASFVSPKLVIPNKVALSKLHIEPLTAQETWDLIKAHLPMNVKSEASRKRFVTMIEYLAAHGVKISGKVAPNGTSILCEVYRLYDHQDGIFKAAFRDEDNIRFLHVDFRATSQKTFWLSAGLRARPPTGAMMPEHFLECALAINRRWDPANTTQTFEEDAQTVAAYLQFDRPEFRDWTNWAQISSIQMFRVRGIPVNESSYRRNGMRREKSHCSLEEAASLDHVRIVWSQTNFLQNPPCPYVYQRLPRGGIPTAIRVYEHLLFLMTIFKDITQYDLAEYLRDVQASYEHLQDELEATRLIPGVHQAHIWLNLDTTQVDLIVKDNLQDPTSARLLCLNCPVDPLPLKTAKKFLVPYEKLLMGLGCKSVKQPNAAHAPGPSTDNRELSLAAAMAEMRDLRDQHQLTDVILEAEGIQHPAHKIVLAAVSKYCKAQFAGEWGRLLLHQATIHLGQLRATTLSQMIDFAYTGEVEWPQLQDPEDNTEIADRLDELLDLLDGTNMWMLDRLHGTTQDFLTSQSWSAIYIRVDNVNGVKERARDARASRLLKHCEDFELVNSELVAAFRNDGSEVGGGMELD